MTLYRAKQYLHNVFRKKELVPFIRYRYGVNGKSQNKKTSYGGRWPVKSAKILLKILKNGENNAIQKGFDPNQLSIKNLKVNKAMKGRRRIFRAHGRVNPYLSHPCHIELELSEKVLSVEKSFY